ncbi:MAG: divergent polysaccharide deacetylase family protein [Syntrophales bacterium]
MGRRKKRFRKTAATGLIILLITGLAALGAYFALKEKRGHRGPTQPAISAGDKDSWPPARKTRLRKKLAIILDDIGHDPVILEEFLRIPEPITFAVLPRLAHSREAAEKIHKAGREVILHLPMEPHGYPGKDPGRGALMTRMDPGEIRAELGSNIASVPHAVGANNHMGSRFMEEDDKVMDVLRSLKARGFYFIDSLTTGRSRAGDLAARSGTSFAERDLFIDRDPEEWTKEEIRTRIVEGDWRHKVLIGHARPETVKTIRKIASVLDRRRIEIVPASRIIKEKGRKK